MKLDIKKINLPYAISEMVEYVEIALNGSCYLVGGAVIDVIQGREPKDIDIEVFGAPLEALNLFLWQYDVNCKQDVGNHFPVLKARVDGIEIDISSPRTERKTSKGHTGFEVEVDLNMTVKKAAMRRDITINALYLDLYHGTVEDPYNGLQDLEAGVIRHIDPTTFVEDPLRVLRIMQLLPRKGKTVHPETILLCSTIRETFSELPGERVFEEFKKLLLKADKPSLGIQFLFDCGWVEHFPEIEALKGTPQNPQWHPEGDVYIHTMMVLDAAAEIRDTLPEDQRLVYMFSALLHDVGKPYTTDPIALTAHGHDAEGVPHAKNFLLRMTNEVNLIRDVCKLVETHMQPSSLVKNDSSYKAWARLHNKVDLNLLGHLCLADNRGVGGIDPTQIPNHVQKCFDFKEEVGPKPIQHLVSGRDIMDLGLEPGPTIGKIKEFGYELQLSQRLTKEQIIEKIKEKYL